MLFLDTFFLNFTQYAKVLIFNEASSKNCQEIVSQFNKLLKHDNLLSSK